MNTHIKSS